MQKLDEFRNVFEGALKNFFYQSFSGDPEPSRIAEAAEYALFSGGKRFRPMLCMATASSLDMSLEKVMGLSAAIEFVHTYSLIHDDLPCMDNDDFRRGQPTAHKKFDEARALLAGDALLTEAFTVLASAYQQTPLILGELVRGLAQRSGARGMVLGQDMDLSFAATGLDKEVLEKVHRLKTGGLISFCVEGPGIIAGASEQERVLLREFGELLGLSFQIKDDLLDQDKNEAQNFIAFLGIAGTEDLLASTLKKLRETQKALRLPGEDLALLVDFNFNRQH